MNQEEKDINKDKKTVNDIKNIYVQAITDIKKIKTESDEKIKNLMQKIDKKSADKILKEIKNLK